MDKQYSKSADIKYNIHSGSCHSVSLRLFVLAI